MKQVYEFVDYKRYIKATLSLGKGRTGNRSKLASHLSCQSAHVSQVLNGHTHFSLEQAFKINSFLGHDHDESHFFLLLVQANRAGSRELENHFRAQIDEILKRRSLINNRLETNRKIPDEAQARYYSSWYYLAIHMAISIPELQNKESLSSYFGLPIEVVSETLNFLLNHGLAEFEQGRYKIGASHIHLGGDADNINKHHTNWRVQVMSSLPVTKSTDLHYSVVFSLSRKDAEGIKERFIQTIRANLEDVGPSKEEVLFSTCLDFFELKR